MPLIRTIAPEEATGELAELYAQIVAARGKVGNNALLYSVSPELLRQQIGFIKYYMTHPVLSMPLLAAIRILVSVSSENPFCIDFNTGFLMKAAGWTQSEIDALKQNGDSAKLSDKERLMLKSVMKAARTPVAFDAQDVEALRQAGWEDRDILDAVNHAARMQGVGTLFNAFKIECEIRLKRD